MPFGILVDSIHAPDERIDGSPLLTLVTQALLGGPDAWAGYSSTGGAGAVPMNRDHAAYLHSRGVQIWPTHNGITAASLARGEAGGEADATAAIAWADEIGIPDNVYVFGDTEAPWTEGPRQPVVGWLLGWARTMRASRLGGAGGVYGSILAGLGADLVEALRQAEGADQENLRRLLIWVAAWQVAPFTRTSLPLWAPPVFAPELGPQVYGWQCTGGAMGGLVDLSLARLPLPGPGGTWRGTWRAA